MLFSFDSIGYEPLLFLISVLIKKIILSGITKNETASETTLQVFLTGGTTSPEVNVATTAKSTSTANHDVVVTGATVRPATPNSTGSIDETSPQSQKFLSTTEAVQTNTAEERTTSEPAITTTVAGKHTPTRSIISYSKYSSIASTTLLSLLFISFIHLQQFHESVSFFESLPMNDTNASACKRVNKREW